MKLVPKCVNCGRELMTEQYIDGQIRNRLTTDYDEVLYQLNDGSSMRVAVCKECQKSKVKVDNETILATVKATWKRELTRISDTGAKGIDTKYADVKIISASNDEPVKPIVIEPIKKEK
jgi:hypothetical protein